jgi:tRNA U55 pseudouridine synthase TruB
MSGLVRTAIGPFALSDSVELGEFNADNVSGHLLPAALAVQGVPPLILTPQEQRQLILGQNIRRADASSEPAEFAAYDADGQLLGILARREGAILKPAKVFAAR